MTTRRKYRTPLKGVRDPYKEGPDPDQGSTGPGTREYRTRIKGAPDPDQGSTGPQSWKHRTRIKEVPTRIKAMDPNVKLLLILRDPAKRLVSDYNQFRNKNLDKGQEYPDLEELLFTPEG